MSAKIIFNGVEYNSVDEMPDEARQAYEQAMQSFGNLSQLGGQFENLNLTTMTFVGPDGKTYNNLDDLPSELREKVEQSQAKWDANQDGIPDVLQQDANHDGTPDAFADATTMNVFTTNNASSIVVDGKSYSSLNDMPADVRQKYQQAMGMLGGDRNQNGIPDMFEGSAMFTAMPPQRSNFMVGILVFVILLAVIVMLLVFLALR